MSGAVSAASAASPMQDQYKERFVSAINEFVNALRRKYKRDASLVDACEKYDIMITNCADQQVKNMLVDKMLKSWYKSFHPLLSEVQSGKFDAVYSCQHALLDELGLKDRFREAKLSTKRVILDHIKNITSFVELYYCTESVTQSLSPGLLQKIADVSQSIGNSGAQPDYAKMIQASQSLIQTLDQNEIASLTKLGQGGAITSVIQQMMGQGTGLDVSGIQKMLNR
jgi:hypothetical protein